MNEKKLQGRRKAILKIFFAERQVNFLKFKCDECGLCCRHIDRSSLLKDFDSGDGVCKFLNTETNLCKIYKDRPDFCNVEVGYRKFFSDIYTEEEFFRLNYKACDLLKAEYDKRE